MRCEDVTNFFQLRKLVANPIEVLRFRKGQRPGHALDVRFRNQPPLTLRGGCADFHMFHRIFLRDEYRVRELAGASLGTVLDLGANVGVFAARIAPTAKRVIACEPVPQNHAQLLRNTAGFPQVHAVRTAVSDRRKTLHLHSPSSPGLSGVYSAFHEPDDPRLSTETIPAPAVSLTDLLEQHEVETVDLLKIDIEGGEYDVLYTAAGFLKQVRRIYGEYHNVQTDAPRTRIDSFEAFLRAEGYARVEIRPHPKWPNHGMFFAGP